MKLISVRVYVCVTGKCEHPEGSLVVQFARHFFEQFILRAKNVQTTRNFILTSSVAVTVHECGY